MLVNQFHVKQGKMSKMPSPSRVKSLLEYFLQFGQLLGDEIPVVPEAGSQGAAEFSDVRFKSHVVNAISNSDLLTEVCFDYLAAGVQLFNQSAFTPFAFAANSRASMECAARSKWLMSPDCDARRRSERSLRARFVCVVENMKTSKTLTTDPASVDKYKAIIDTLRGQATTLGVKLDSKRLLALPSATDLIREMLGAESVYKFLSGAAHGHFYALRELGMHIPATDTIAPDEHGFVKVSHEVNSDLVAISSITLAESFANCVWYNAKYRLKSTLQIEEQIDTGFDIVQHPETRRFWRSRS
ncbi:MAG: hypothetical protein JNK57_12675 [Planctomycetaceae bacterium]|nr:hypothetical protein [Planctomycetaceae bacterium]